MVLYNTITLADKYILIEKGKIIINFINYIMQLKLKRTEYQGFLLKPINGPPEPHPPTPIYLDFE